MIEELQKHIDKIKKENELKAKKEAEQAEREANKLANNATLSQTNLPKGNQNGNLSVFSPKAMPNPSSSNDEQSTFYFYNPVTVAFGKKEFKNRWGNRTHRENWKLSSIVADNKIETLENQETDSADEDSLSASVFKPEYEIEFYTSKLPTEKKVIDSIHKERNFAYYQLGIIYKEKFKEYELAASRLEKLLDNNPEERLILPAKYNLFKIYEIIDPSKAAQYKNQILTEYPTSRYAQIIANPSITLEDETNPEIIYNKLYKIGKSRNL